MNRKVMIIDDDKEFLEELNETLKLSGYEMIAANDPLTVMDLARAEKPDVILLDLKMPGKNGFQLAKELKYLSEISHIPIIAMSAYFRDEYASLLSMCDIEKCLKKPFNPLDVIFVIEEALGQKKYF